MRALLERSDQVISVTEVSRSAKTIFDRLCSGEQKKYVVMKNNIPAAVLMPVSVYEALLDELDDLQAELRARDRLQTLERAFAAKG